MNSRASSCSYFSVTIENSIQEYYWTEKVVDCFATKTVPIFWGSREVCAHFDNDGIFIFVTIDELESILNDMTPDLYEKMLPAVERNFDKVEEYGIPEDWCFKKYPFLFE